MAVMRLNNFYTDGSGLDPIPIPDVGVDSRAYLQSDLHPFRYVFHKDNLPTYHQQYDRFLHWEWNEYQNDPERFESDAYKESVVDKVFNLINARILGVVNNAMNHSQIIRFIDALVLDVDMQLYIADKRSKMVDRKTEFLPEEDAIVWWKMEKQLPTAHGFVPKPIIRPYIILDNGDFWMIEDFRQFYLMIFQYPIEYYNHVYPAKFQSNWKKVDESDFIYAQWTGFLVSEMSQDCLGNQIEIGNRVTDLFCEENWYPIGHIDLDVGKAAVFLISSKKGQYHDKWMNPMTYAIIAHAADGWYISAQRGFDIFKCEWDGMLETMVVKEHQWVNCLSAKSKSDEEVLSDMWRDVMQCNGVLFQMKGDHTFTMDLRITNYDRYSDKISLCLGLGDRITKVTGNKCYNIARITITDIKTLVEIWKVMEHTLNLWVKYHLPTHNGGFHEIEQWSLISNLYIKNMQYYHENPHVMETCVKWCDDMGDVGDVVTVIPRDGIAWTVDGHPRTFCAPEQINGHYVRKAYL